MAYLVIHPISHGRATNKKDSVGFPIVEVRHYQPGETFEPQPGEDVDALLAVGSLVEDGKLGPGQLAVADASRAATQRPYGLL